MNDEEIGRAEERGWTYRADEVDGVETGIRLVLTGSRSDPVTVHGFSIRVLARRAPVRGVALSPGAGGEVVVRHLRADLDKNTMTWSSDGNNRLAPLTLELERGEQEVIDIMATTMSCDCDWVLDVKYSVGADVGTVTVPPHGHFRTTALSRVAFLGANEHSDALCEDFSDLNPTMCDALPKWFGAYERNPAAKLQISRVSRSGRYATGWGLFVADESG